jgi:hypothetical protein
MYQELLEHVASMKYAIEKFVNERFGGISMESEWKQLYDFL